MSGIQVSGLLSNQAFDWKSVVDQLIAADSIPLTNLQTQQTTNTSKVTALSSLQTDLTNLQTSLQNIRAGNLFSARVVSSDTANTTWSSTSSTGATLGTYTFAVQTLASRALTQGKANLSAGLGTATDGSDITLGSMNTATAFQAGTLTVNGNQITVTAAESLKDVFTAIAAATGGDVTGSYDPAHDQVSLTSGSGAGIVLGSANDSSTLLTALKLYNNGSSTVTSATSLGTIKTGATLASAGFSTPFNGALTGGTGDGSLKINGVTINYSINTDTVSTLMGRINNSAAGVTASYDSATNRFNLTNNNTGDFGMGLQDTTGNLLAAMGLTAGLGTFQRGSNATYTVNGGPLLTSTSNTLDASSHGITGFSVIVNSVSTQTLSVQSATTGMQNAIQDFIPKFNTVQNDISTDVKTAINASSVSTSVLTGNLEVEDWASSLQSLAFAKIPGISQTVTSLSSLGVDFDGQTLNGNLLVKDSTALSNALTQNPADVQAYFNNTGGLVDKLYGYITNAMASNTQQQDTINKSNTGLATQITNMQAKLADERTTLTNSFIAMLDAQSKAQSQSSSLTASFFQNNSSSTVCWVARVVYGPQNPLWLLFRHWLQTRAPTWFFRAYRRYGHDFACWLEDKPACRAGVRLWMDARIRRMLQP